MLMASPSTSSVSYSHAASSPFLPPGMSMSSAGSPYPNPHPQAQSRPSQSQPRPSTSSGVSVALSVHSTHSTQSQPRPSTSSGTSVRSHHSANTGPRPVSPNPGANLAPAQRRTPVPALLEAFPSPPTHIPPSPSPGSGTPSSNGCQPFPSALYGGTVSPNGTATTTSSTPTHRPSRSNSSAGADAGPGRRPSIASRDGAHAESADTHAHDKLRVQVPALAPSTSMSSVSSVSVYATPPSSAGSIVSHVGELPTIGFGLAKAGADEKSHRKTESGGGPAVPESATLPTPAGGWPTAMNNFSTRKRSGSGSSFARSLGHHPQRSQEQSPRSSLTTHSPSHSLASNPPPSLPPTTPLPPVPSPSPGDSAAAMLFITGAAQAQYGVGPRARRASRLSVRSNDSNHSEHRSISPMKGFEGAPSPSPIAAIGQGWPSSSPVSSRPRGGSNASSSAQSLLSVNNGPSRSPALSPMESPTLGVGLGAGAGTSRPPIARRGSGGTLNSVTSTISSLGPTSSVMSTTSGAPTASTPSSTADEFGVTARKISLTQENLLDVQEEEPELLSDAPPIGRRAPTAPSPMPFPIFGDDEDGDGPGNSSLADIDLKELAGEVTMGEETDDGRAGAPQLERVRSRGRRSRSPSATGATRLRNPHSPPASPPPPARSATTQQHGEHAQGARRSPEIGEMLRATPRPRKSSSRLRAKGSGSRLSAHSRESIGSTSTASRLSVGSSSRVAADGLGYLEDERGGGGASRSMSGRGGDGEEQGGSDSDSSLDLHTPLPHLMLREGMLSPHSKLLPFGDRERETPSSRLSVISTGSNMTGITATSAATNVSKLSGKPGPPKDKRDTPRRRVRHRDGKLLKGGIGLTTGLGWSDSEDEDAPSELTRRLSSLALSRRSSNSSVNSAFSQASVPRARAASASGSVFSSYAPPSRRGSQLSTKSYSTRASTYSSASAPASNHPLSRSISYSVLREDSEEDDVDEFGTISPRTSNSKSTSVVEGKAKTMGIKARSMPARTPSSARRDQSGTLSPTPSARPPSRTMQTPKKSHSPKSSTSVAEERDRERGLTRTPSFAAAEIMFKFAEKTAASSSPAATPKPVPFPADHARAASPRPPSDKAGTPRPSTSSINSTASSGLTASKSASALSASTSKPILQESAAPGGALKTPRKYPSTQGLRKKASTTFSAVPAPGGASGSGSLGGVSRPRTGSTASLAKSIGPGAIVGGTGVAMNLSSIRGIGAGESRSEVGAGPRKAPSASAASSSAYRSGSLGKSGGSSIAQVLGSSVNGGAGAAPSGRTTPSAGLRMPGTKMPTTLGKAPVMPRTPLRTASLGAGATPLSKSVSSSSQQAPATESMSTPVSPTSGVRPLRLLQPGEPAPRGGSVLAYNRNVHDAQRRAYQSQSQGAAGAPPSGGMFITRTPSSASATSPTTASGAPLHGILKSGRTTPTSPREGYAGIGAGALRKPRTGTGMVYRSSVAGSSAGGNSGPGGLGAGGERPRVASGASGIGIAL